MQMQYWISRSCYSIRNGFWDLMCRFSNCFLWFHNDICVFVDNRISIFRVPFMRLLRVLFGRYFVDLITLYYSFFPCNIIYKRPSPCNQFSQRTSLILTTISSFNEAFKPSYIGKLEFQRWIKGIIKNFADRFLEGGHNVVRKGCWGCMKEEPVSGKNDKL